MSNPGDILNDKRAASVVAGLHARGRREIPSIMRHYFTRWVGTWFTGRGLSEPDARDMVFLRDKLISLTPEKCDLCYLLCRALDATRVVEVGTSFAVSTIYLAAAVRDNAARSGRAASVIGTEIDPVKVGVARQNLAAAGLADLVDVREGDARETLRGIEGPIDFVLIDTWIPLSLVVLKMLQPALRPGAIVACDNVTAFRKEYKVYLDYVRDPANGFRSLCVPYAGGVEFSVRAD